MKAFDDLQAAWNQQPKTNFNTSATDVIEKAEAHTKKVKYNHLWTIGIISLTSVILILYYFWIGVYKLNAFSLGLGIMISMLLFRVLLEWISIKKFNAIKADNTLIEYSKQARQFYYWRKKNHFVLTPIIYFSYLIGFIILLPGFKQNFSQGFYLYIIISGLGFLILFGFVIMKKVKQELKLLEFLKNIS